MISGQARPRQNPHPVPSHDRKARLRSRAHRRKHQETRNQSGRSTQAIPSSTCRSRRGWPISTPRSAAIIPNTAWALMPARSPRRLSAHDHRRRGRPVGMGHAPAAPPSCSAIGWPISSATTAPSSTRTRRSASIGQLLHTAALLDERAGPAGWWPEGFAAGSNRRISACNFRRGGQRGRSDRRRARGRHE